MNILLISQCSKRALTETRRILDQFAERRGDRTWQTAITQNGLNTLRTLLRKTARKNTAVACHWIRGKDNSELLWIVGDARQFNARGATPTNITQRDILRAADENNWHSAEDIRLLVSIAALFHDFGKATQLFQEKLKTNARIADPYRHEWISLRLFEAFVDNDSDDIWLQRLAKADTGSTTLCLEHLYRDGLDKQPCMPFKRRSALVQTIGWLIVSHHRLPAPTGKGIRAKQLNLLPAGIVSDWCGARTDVSDGDLKKCWTIKNGLPFDSQHWQQRACKIAQAMQVRPHFLTHNWCHDPYIAHLSRMILILADHYYSGQERHKGYGDKEFPLYANTDRTTGKFKQRLDEHLIGVEINAQRILKTLPQLTQSLHSIGRHKGFRQRTKDKRFSWQDKAFDLAGALQQKSEQQGFFGINMASTGCGKTLANGRIMYALANPQRGARFTIALGLRTLTLQTGNAYRERLNLSDSDLAVMVGGGSAIKELHTLGVKQNKTAGSESAQSLMPEWQHVHFEGSLEGPLNHWLNNDPQASRLVNAPVVTCTIDHLMPATESTRGGQQIPPMLRLLSSDLVLDEPDDFALEDLPALTRLVNWAGMLGSRVLLSSATLPPALVQGLFDAYRAGRAHFQNNRGIPGQPLSVCCAWFDEYGTASSEHHQADNFLVEHEQFVEKRLQKLADTLTTDQRRKAQVIPLPLSASAEDDDFYPEFAQLLQQRAMELHQQHRLTDPHTGKHLSIGLIRMANINPLVATAQALLNLGADCNSRIHLCVYHSQHPLLVRSAIERKLDQILTRHDEQQWWEQDNIRQLLDQHDEQEQIVIILGTAVTEVGRDHDYDWSIIEPSSMRSIIQLAGRIRRHRPGMVNDTNMYLLDTNIRHLKAGSQAAAFCRPGFESNAFHLNSHYLHDLLTDEQWQQIDASSRIRRRSAESPADNLVDLEHHTTEQCLIGNDNGQHIRPPANRWWTTPASLTASEQKEHPFRQSGKRQRYFLIPEDGNIHFRKFDGEHEIRLAHLLNSQAVSCAAGISSWGVKDYLSELENLAEQLDMEPTTAAYRFGYIDLPAEDGDKAWNYHPLLGFSRIN